MIVKPKLNRRSDLSDDLKASFGNEELNLSLGKNYVVYGLAFHQGHLWFYLIDDARKEGLYPIWYPSALFDVVDGRMPSFWRLGIRTTAPGRLAITIAFKQWAENPYFYDDLTNGVKEAVSAWQEHRKLTDQESSQ
jgi:hypothetical protein